MSTGVRVTPSGRGTADWVSVLATVDRWTLDDLWRWSAGADHLVVVSAHPDDETIGAGRLLAAWTRSGRSATALLATAGEACVDHVAPRPPGLAERRLAEWHAAQDALGVTDREVLALPDGRLEESTDELETAVTVRVLAVGGSSVIVAPYETDPHPDHRAAGRVAATVSRHLGRPMLQYPVWMGFWSDPAAAPNGLRRLQVSAEIDDFRAAALREFRSQLEPLHPGLDPVVPGEMLEHHRDQLLLPTPIGVS